MKREECKDPSSHFAPPSNKHNNRDVVLPLQLCRSAKKWCPSNLERTDGAYDLDAYGGGKSVMKPHPPVSTQGK